MARENGFLLSKGGGPAMEKLGKPQVISYCSKPGDVRNILSTRENNLIRLSVGCEDTDDIANFVGSTS